MYSGESGDVIRKTEQLCGEQRRGWLEGRRLSVAKVLDEHPELQDEPEALFQLVFNEICIREELGDEVAVAEYERQYPELAERLRAAAEFSRDLRSTGSTLAASALPAAGALAADGTTGLNSAAAPADESPFTGTQRFRVLRPLGVGGMGRVFEVYDSLWDQRVALKILHRSDPQSLVRLRREFRALADLSHPGLVQLFELHHTERFCFFTMELVLGVDPLAWCMQLAGERSGTAMGRVRQVVWQLADVLTALHEAGKVHCDIKSSNLLVTDSGRLVLLDFGLASEHFQDIAGRPPDRLIGGTQAYMAPERREVGQTSPAADWYSVGVLLYLLLTGRHPFSGTPDEIQQQIVAGPKPPAELREGTPGELNQLCLDLLTHDPVQRPTGREVLRRVGHSRRRRRTAVLADESDLFVGRERELRVLLEAWQRAREGRVAGVLLHGTSGIGKTTLAQAFMRRLLRDENVCTLTGRCYETESVAFKALDRLVDDLAAELEQLPADERHCLLPPGMPALARMFPALAAFAEAAPRDGEPELATDPHELRMQAATAFQELLLRLARGRPVIVFIDDIQWGDADSAGLIKSLLESRRDASLLLVFSCRSENLQGSVLPEHICQVGSGRVQHLEVAPLSESDGHRLAQLCLQHADDALRDRAGWVAAEAGNSPLFIHALARWVRERRTPSGRPRAGGVDALLADFVRRLEPSARDVVHAIAVAGHPLKFRDACRAAAVDQDQQKILMALRAKRILRIQGLGEAVLVEIYHDRIREGVVRQLTLDQKWRWHLRLADVLQADAERNARHLALHYHAAGKMAQAGRYARVAAQQADQSFAFDDAARFYRLALESHQGMPDERLLLQGRLAAALMNAGRGAEAGAVYVKLAAQQQGVAAARSQQRAAEQLLRAGMLEEGIAAFRDLAERQGLRWPKTSKQAVFRFLAGRLWLRIRGCRFRERAEAEIDERELLKVDTCWTAVHTVAMVDLMRAYSFAPQYTRLALKSGEPGRVARALALEAFLCYMNDSARSPRAVRLMDQAEAVAQRAKDARAAAEVQFFRTGAAFYQGDWARVVRLSEEAERFMRRDCAGLTWEIATLRVYRLHALFYLGQFRKQTEEIFESIDEAHHLGDHYFAAGMRTGTSNIAWLLDDKPGDAREQLVEARRLWPGHDDLSPAFVYIIAHMQIELYEGRGKAAWQYIREVWPQLVAGKQLRLALLRAEMFSLRGRAAVAAAEEGERDESVLQKAEADASNLERLPFGWTRPLATLLRAGVARRRGQTARAEQLLRMSIDQCDANRLAMYAAAARYRLGQLIGGDDGQRLVAAACDAFRREGVANHVRMTSLLAP